MTGYSPLLRSYTSGCSTGGKGRHYISSFELTSTLVNNHNETGLNTSHFPSNEEKRAFEWVDTFSTTFSPVIARGSKTRIPLSAPGEPLTSIVGGFLVNYL